MRYESFSNGDYVKCINANSRKLRDLGIQKGQLFQVVVDTEDRNVYFDVKDPNDPDDGRIALALFIRGEAAFITRLFKRVKVVGPKGVKRELAKQIEANGLQGQFSVGMDSSDALQYSTGPARWQTGITALIDLNSQVVESGAYIEQSLRDSDAE